jgi:hypothetical protein
VYYRCWDRLKADLYVLTVRTVDASPNENMATAIETIISEAFDKARADLASDLERTEVLRDQVQLTDMPDWDDRLEAEATYSTPRAREFLALIQQMDQLLMLYHALWLAGFAKTADCKRRSQNWARRLTKITNRLRELASRTRASLARTAPGDPSANASGDVGDHPLAASEADVNAEERATAVGGLTGGESVDPLQNGEHALDAEIEQLVSEADGPTPDEEASLAARHDSQSSEGSVGVSAIEVSVRSSRSSAAGAR